MDGTRSQRSDDSILQSHAGNNLVSIQEQDSTKRRFKKQLYISSILFSMMLLATFLGIFIYYLQNKMLDGKDIIVPNHYLIKSVSFTPTSVALHAEYQGEGNPIYPNIFPYIVVNIKLNTLPPQIPNETDTNILEIDIQQEKQQINLMGDEEINIHNVKFMKENQLELKDVDLGPFDLQYSNQGSKLAFIISRNATGEKIFDTLDYDIMVSQYFTTLGTFLPSGSFYGLGERRMSQFQYQRKALLNCTYGSCNKYRFWNRNPLYTQESFDSGLGSGQLSGYQPVYLVKEQSDNYSLIYIQNSFSGLEIDYYLHTDNSNKLESLIFSNFNSKITFQIFLGDKDPETVIKQYHHFIGPFNLIPFWAMGYHHSKTFSIPIQQNFQAFLDYLTKLNLPIDSIWTTIEMNENGNYFKLLNPDVIKKMKNERFLKWIPLIPSQIPNMDTNKDYIQKISDAKAFIYSNKTKQPYVGQSIQGRAFYLDYNNVNSKNLFGDQLSTLFQQQSFDGIWLDKNEPSTVSTGEYIEQNKISVSNGEFDSIYSQITNFNFNQNLLNIDALHYNKPDAPYFYLPDKGENIYEKDLHSSNGFMQSSTTFNILQEKLQIDQPFIISSSNRPGSGINAAHSTGNVQNDWSVLQSSFIEIFDFQLFGIPFAGNNICPIKVINDNNIAATSELCARWYQAASVFPFMHSSQTNLENDPFSFSDYGYVLNSVKESLILRYSLLKHYYSLYVMKKGRGMVFKPVGFVFPETMNYSYYLLNSNNTAMIGDSLFVFTVMTQGDQSTNYTQVEIGIPPNLWVNLLNTHIQYKGPFEAKYNFPFSGSPLIFLREGHLILWQQINKEKMIRASLLNSSFVIKGVLTVLKTDNLTIQYQTKGKTIGVLDYGNSEALKKCEKQGCELNITLDVISIDNKELEIIISFLAEDTQYFEPGIIIVEIQLSGVIKYNDIVLQYCQNNNSPLPFDYITVKHSLDPLDTYIVSQRNSSFKLKIPF